MLLSTEKGQENTLIAALCEMDMYLQRLELGCTEISEVLHTKRSEALEQLMNIVEGLGFCLRLFESARVLLGINAKTEFQTLLSKAYTDLDQSISDQDFSLLADLVEYDLTSVIQSGQQELQVYLQACSERNG